MSDIEEPSTLELILEQLTRIADSLDRSLVYDLADGPVEIPPGETRTFVIRPVDPDEPIPGNATRFHTGKDS